ncbi:MAG: hypothetical protein ACE5GT_06395 [Rhodospirillales bacterium]
MTPAISIATAASADETEHILTEQGTRLGILFTDGKVDDLRFTVDLNGDQPDATYIWATVGSNDFRVRTNEGYWLPWTGNLESLVDNRFPITDGKVTFKVLDENIGVDNHGVTIRIGYKVGDTLKYGIFGILPKAKGQ